MTWGTTFTLLGVHNRDVTKGTNNFYNLRSVYLMCVVFGLHACVHYTLAVPTVARRGTQLPWNWSYLQL